MANRRAVPAALHSELTEYSSLIRALQTSKTLDLAAHLASSQPTLSSRRSIDEAGYDDDDEAEGSQLPSTTGGPSSQDIHGAAGASSAGRSTYKAKLKRKADAKGKARDTWTRWPLLAGDVHVPEWGLEDEVKYIALQYLRSKSQLDDTPSTLPPETEEDSHDLADEDEGGLLSSHALHALTASSSIYLSQILALLAAHVPYAEKSMQNRIHPINWESVLDIVAANGLASPTFVHLLVSR